MTTLSEGFKNLSSGSVGQAWAAAAGGGRRGVREPRRRRYNLPHTGPSPTPAQLTGEHKQIRAEKFSTLVTVSWAYWQGSSEKVFWMKCEESENVKINSISSLPLTQPASSSLRSWLHSAFSSEAWSTALTQVVVFILITIVKELYGMFLQMNPSLRVFSKEGSRWEAYTG